MPRSTTGDETAPARRRRRTSLAASAAALCLLAGGATANAAGHHGPPPSGKLPMSGDTGDYEAGVVDDPAHDPTLFSDRGTYYVFSTGVANPDDPGGIFVRRSTDLAGPWESVGAIELPEWTRAYGVGHLWAPHVVQRGNTFYLYYSASSFGSNNSAIGVATTRTPGDLDSWVDHGPVLRSDTDDDFNAIDPQVFSDGGQWYIAFGSFWTGVKIQRLADMFTPTGPVIDLASNPVDPPNAIENPQVFKRGGYWYLTASWDFCCQGVNSTYKTVVGRSKSPTGPFVDREGRAMTDGGGTLLLGSRGNQVGTGALDVLNDRGRTYAVHHYYDAATGGTIRMQIREVEWRDGWPYFSYGPGDGAPAS
ncbi:arabinan endo-1,5-alpha-L-arabinosidase [Paenibacillus sp. TRM 82003]|uniref:arabinan endo-1,5-alpha-L-arabinosidase n=1 Tax=Kineococcus sp. TRM81007 TaxID=2925831 RepID=UPI001F594755|nr:arabinan endo-1,5-alpha-L-arabinosidase [Kineococcus sp. TRM81007]MCI2240653.1 arabinan endo-1,5-alpha-L-arabinosidase [Kineococcus sp. TRM81007]MCI3925424.1 arabinan endo-1,5-alpha-L-arabinosidase [Paenibacillus sp. TRM 82003]